MYVELAFFAPIVDMLLDLVISVAFQLLHLLARSDGLEVDLISNYTRLPTLGCLVGVS